MLSNGKEHFPREVVFGNEKSIAWYLFSSLRTVLYLFCLQHIFYLICREQQLAQGQNFIFDSSLSLLSDNNLIFSFFSAVHRKRFLPWLTVE